jgi:hypothetical protein
MQGLCATRQLQAEGSKSRDLHFSFCARAPYKEGRQ